MSALLASLVEIAVVLFALSSMLSVGVGHDWRHLIGPLRNTRAVIGALLANFVLVPLLMIGILQFVPLDRPLSSALFLVATAAGAPFLIKLTEVAQSNVALSATLLVLLLPVTILYMPIIAPLVLPQARMSALAIARPLVLTMLLPLALGLLVRDCGRLGADRWSVPHRPGARGSGPGEAGGAGSRHGTTQHRGGDCRCRRGDR